MRRVVAALAVWAVGIGGLAQLSGDWSATVAWKSWPGTLVIEGMALRLAYTTGGWTLVSKSAFADPDGWVDQVFGVEGEFGPLGIKGAMWFDPATPAYLAAEVTGSLGFGGIDLSLSARHWTDGNYLWADGDAPCDPQVDAGLQYVFKAAFPPVSLQVRFADCCTGTWFQEFVLTLEDLSPCCGIAFDLEVWFTKAGFQYVALSAENVLPLCCGVSFDLGVTFGVDAKTVTLTPKLAGWGEGCLTVYGDVDWWEDGAVTLGGIRLDGFKVRCELGDCTFAEFVTFLSPENAPLYGYEGVFNPSIGEFEFVRFGFCGPGCCGGKYGVTVTAYFHDDAYVIQPILPPWWPPRLPPGGRLPPFRPELPPEWWVPGPIKWPPLPPPPWPMPPQTLFALSRVQVEASVPVSDAINLYLGVQWGWFLVSGPTWAEVTSLWLGWRIAF